MKSLRLMFLMLMLIAGIDPVSAQFTINKVTPKEADTKAIQDTLSKRLDLTSSFFSESRYQAERRRIRKERNTVNLTTTLSLTQTGFDNWAAGGQNTFTGRATVSFAHQYKKNKFNFNYDFEARYGLNIIDTASFKNEDMFRLNINPSIDLNKNWSYAALFQFASQFTKGYKSMTEHILVSDFMAPGTLTLGLGFTYKHQKIPLTINISPLTGSMTFVRNDSLSSVGAYGVDPGKTMKSSLGSQLILNMAVPFAKNRITYTSYLDVFSNYDKVTRVTWDNKLDFTVFKFMTLNLFCSTKYDHTVNFAESADDPFLRRIQWKYSLGVGFTYVFKNK